MHKRIFLLLIAAGSMLTKVSAQQVHRLTVQQAAEMAVNNVAQMKNANLDYQIQEAQNKEIFGQALPQITGNAAVQYYLQLPKILFPDGSQAGIYNVLIKEGLLPTGTIIPSPTLQQVSFQQPWNTNIGATLTQLLFQPDVFVGLQARSTALQLSNENREQVRQTLLDTAYKKYYAILIAQKQLFYLDEGIQRLEKFYADDSALFVNGFVERLDLDKIQVQLTNLRTTRTVVKNAVDLSFAALKFAIGVSQKDTVILTDDLSTDEIKKDILVDSFKYEDRVEIRQLYAARKLQQLDVKRNKLGYLPTVAAQANYTYSGMGQDFITNKSTTWIKSSYVGLSVNVPIFDGLQRKYKIRQSELSVQKVDNNIDLTKQGIDLEQTVTKSLLTNSILNLDAQERNMQLALKVYNTTKTKYESGIGSSFEVLQADADYQTAQNNYFTALYNALVSKISYQKSLGKLN